MLATNINYLLQKDPQLSSILGLALNVTTQQLSNFTTQNITGAQLLVLATQLNTSIQNLLTVNLALRHTVFNTIKLLVLDVDGVMTNGGMYYSENGDEFKRFNTKDGYAIRALTKNGFEVGIISNGKNSNLITERAKLLGINKVYVGSGEKLEILNQWCTQLTITPSQVAYIGDDLNDYNIIQAVGFSACPADACLPIKNLANITLTTRGGYGCVREFYDTYLTNN